MKLQITKGILANILFRGNNRTSGKITSYFRNYILFANIVENLLCIDFTFVFASNPCPVSNVFNPFASHSSV